MSYLPAEVNEESLAEILQDTAPMLRLYLERRIPSRLRPLISADDLLQEVWIDAFRALPTVSVSGISGAQRWLLTLCRRRLINSIRHLQRLKRGGDRGNVALNARKSTSVRDLLVSLVASNRTPSSMAGVTEAADAVTAAISELPAACRQAIYLRFIAGHPLTEVAKRMNRSTNSVRALIFRGLRELKVTLGNASKYLTDATLT